MITLYPEPEFYPSKYGRPAGHAKRIPLKSETPLSAHQIKAEARRLLSGGLPSRVWRALDLLSVGGVLSAARLGIQPRMLRHWSAFGLFERLQIAPQEVKRHYENFGLKDGDPTLYCLGAVGLEIATGRHETLPPSGYQGYSSMRVMHDLMTNEIVLRAAEKLGASGGTVEWLGKYEITLSTREGAVMLEPDALLRFRKGDEERAFVFEYHNEDKRTRAIEKVEKYERAHEGGDWQKRWDVEWFPPVLAICWQEIVAKGYVGATSNRRRLNCSYYVKILKSVLEGNVEEWSCITTKERRRLF